MPALEFLDLFEVNSKAGCIFDPPYSPRQVMECYKGIGLDVVQKDTQMNFYSDAKNKIAKVVELGGIVICCGWNSCGLGINRGFKMQEVLLVPHGGSRNDTIVTVEKKIKIITTSKLVEEYSEPLCFD